MSGELRERQREPSLVKNSPNSLPLIFHTPNLPNKIHLHQNFHEIGKGRLRESCGILFVWVCFARKGRRIKGRRERGKPRG